MSQILFMILIMINSMLFSTMLHPMNMGIILLIQTLMVCVLTSILSYSAWFSYILFLVFLGGMLVLFIYMTSIASNEMFKKSMYPMTMMLMTMTMLLYIIMITDPYMISILPDKTNLLIFSQNGALIPLYSLPMSNITLFMVLYLFLTLIVVAYITKYNKGPLRPLN